MSSKINYIYTKIHFLRNNIGKMINDLFENVVFKECIILHEFNELLLTF